MDAFLYCSKPDRQLDKGYSERGRVEEEVNMDSVRRTMLKTGAAATAVAAAPGVFAPQAEQADTFYENGSIHIHFEQTGSGSPCCSLLAGD